MGSLMIHLGSLASCPAYKSEANMFSSTLALLGLPIFITDF